MINNNITKSVYSDEWYTSRATVEAMLDIFPCNDTDTILCPFDSEKSQFVKVLQERGHKVIYSIRDFLERAPYSFDCIYTNPPVQRKDGRNRAVHRHRKEMYSCATARQLRRSETS